MAMTLFTPLFIQYSMPFSLTGLVVLPLKAPFQLSINRFPCFQLPYNRFHDRVIDEINCSLKYVL